MTATVPEQKSGRSPVLANSDSAERWTQLALLAAIELLAMALWFSASAAAGSLKTAWSLSGTAQAWLTISVQLGFVAGALASAFLNLSERIAAPRMLAVSALLGALANGAIPLFISDDLGRTSCGFALLIALRMITGVMLAGVYPTGMKLLATWFTRGRGLAIGVMVGALTVGSASPHLLTALVGGSARWQPVMLAASASALVAAAIAWAFVRTGPNLPAATRFEWSYFARMWTEPAIRRANFGYLGHMFELYAMWTWVPQVLRESYLSAGSTAESAALAGFLVVASGGIGCVIAGLTADRSGRALTTIVSLAISGGCALVAGWLVPHPAWLTLVCLVWGLSVVADSAQFSAAVSELCDPKFVGTALTVQTCVGFLLTTLTIQAMPVIRQWLSTAEGTDTAAGWGWAFAILALGPAFGIYHMARLRQMPEARKMAGGNR
jgi:MFS family permease